MKILKSLILALLLITPLTAYADTGVLTWNANTEADLAGYKVYQSTVSGVYSTPVATLGKVVTHTLTLPQLSVDTRYFVTITAYDLSGNESLKSTEVSKLVPASVSDPIVVTLIDAQGTWVRFASNKLTLNTTLISNNATDLRLCNGVVHFKHTNLNWYHYVASTNTFTIVPSVCSDITSPAPPTGLIVK